MLWCRVLAAFEVEEVFKPLDGPEVDPLVVMYDDTPVTFKPKE